MSRGYYYLIASLPEYAFETDTKINIDAIREEIKSELSESDRSLVELLYTYYDIGNVIIYLKDSKAPFNTLGNLDPAQVKAEIDDSDDDEDNVTVSLLPSNIRLAIDRYKGRFPEEDSEPDPDLKNAVAEDIERQLYGDFYELCRRSRNKFIRKWADIDRTIRNIIAASRARALGVNPADMIIGSGEIENLLLTNQSSDFGMKDIFEYSEELFHVLETEDFVERERNMDAMMWSIVNRLTEHEYFSIDVILAYLIKLNILYRWEALDKQTGRDRFRLMVENLTNIDVDRD